MLVISFVNGRYIFSITSYTVVWQGFFDIDARLQKNWSLMALQAIEDGTRVYLAYPSSYDLVEAGNRWSSIVFVLQYVLY